MDAERRREAKTDIQPIEHGIEAKWIKQGLHEIMDRDAGLMACVASTYPTDFARAVSFSDFPLTGKALYMLYSKCLLIKDALYRQAAEDDIHSMLILYRSYVDQSSAICLSSQIIFFRIYSDLKIIKALSTSPLYLF